MKLALQTNSVAAWDATLAAIKQATKSIYIEMYIFSDDTRETHAFVEALTQRALAGVEVILILDAFGSMGLPKHIITTLTEAGAEIRFFRHWIHRTHRKTIIIDGSRAFVGGVNITKHAAHWNDLQLEVTGMIVARLTKVFVRTYKLSGGKRTLRTRTTYTNRKHRIRMWVLEHTPIARRKTLRSYYTKKLRGATTSIVFVTPYFIPHTWFMEELAHAAMRQVEVTILIPDHTDSAILDSINRFYAGVASRYGAHIRIMPGVNHAKAVLVDRTEGMIGSANLDLLSFWQNSEVGLFFTDEQAVHALTHVIDTWSQTSTPYQEQQHTLRWYHLPFVWMFRLLYLFV